MLFDRKSILKLTDTKWFLMNSNAYVFPLWKKHLPNLMMQHLYQLLIIDGKKLNLWRKITANQAFITSLSLSLYTCILYIYIYIYYFNCEISSHLKLAIRWVDLNLLKFALHAPEIANQTSNTMKHKPLVWTSCAFGRPWEGKSSLDLVWTVGTRHVADVSEVKLCLLRSKCAIQCEYFHAK